MSPIGKSSGTQQDVLNYGMKYLNTPYRYAGRTPAGFDCSGFTSFVFKEFGYKLNGSSAGQDKQVPSINNKRELRVGDLVFFEGRSHNGKVGHVGIVKDLLPGGEFTFLHSSTSNGVIISRSTEPYYASRYLRGGRILKENNQVAVVQRTYEKPVVQNTTKEEARNTAKLESNIKNTTVAKSPVAHTETATASDSITIHSRPSYLPVTSNSNQSKDNPDSGNHISKDLRRSSNTNVPKPKMKTHRVKPAETLYSIAQNYGVTVGQLRQWNPNLGDVLRAGDEIKVSD